MHIKPFFLPALLKKLTHTNHTPCTDIEMPCLYTDYGGGSVGGYPVENTYGPPKEYYYDERPEYFSPYDHANHHLQGNGPPPEVIYHQRPNPHLQHHHHGGGEVHNSGELNVQPLLWPLAGIALLGVLSALVKTPLLLHLGHIGRRRRRDVNDGDRGISAETIKSLLEKVNIP